MSVEAIRCLNYAHMVQNSCSRCLPMFVEFYLTMRFRPQNETLNDVLITLLSVFVFVRQSDLHNICATQITPTWQPFREEASGLWNGEPVKMQGRETVKIQVCNLFCRAL